jgi:uncharacterized membrane protein
MKANSVRFAIETILAFLLFSFISVVGQKTEHFVIAINEVQNGVVLISCVRDLGSNEFADSAGTGFFVNDDGYFVTARHVIERHFSWDENGEPIGCSPAIRLPKGGWGPNYVVGYYTDVNYVNRGFLWNDEGKMTTFDAMPDANSYTIPRAINSAGQIVGECYATQGSVIHGFLREKIKRQHEHDQTEMR